MSSEDRISIQDGRKPGWYWASNEVIDAYGAEMGPYGLAIYHALCRHANDSGESWPSYATLAKETGMKRRVAIRTMKRLVELELVSKHLRKDEAGDPTSNLYTLLEMGGSAPRTLGSTPGTLGVVREGHQGSVSGTPEQDSSNKTHIKKRVDVQLKDEHGKYINRTQERCSECGQFQRQCICG